MGVFVEIAARHGWDAWGVEPSRWAATLAQQAGFRVISVQPQGRYLRSGYLASRVAAFNQPLGRALGWLFARLRLNGRAIPINLGDLVTMYARKPE